MLKNAILELTRIVQDVALIETPERQVEFIVDSISHVIAVDVCTLYRQNYKGEMEMLATHGLSSVHPLIIPPQKGLVGLVARSRHPINLDNAPTHPEFHYVPNCGEGVFKGFCGVPLVSHGDVIGVLVVQRYEALKLNDLDEAFLVTISSQLALLVSRLAFKEAVYLDNSISANGVSGSAGLGIGQVHLCLSAGLNSIVDKHCDDVEVELDKWKRLIVLAQIELRREQSSLGDKLSQDVSSIFDVYLKMLEDPSLINKVEQEIREGFCMMSALNLSIKYFTEVFRNIDDPYLRARGEDMQHLGNKLFDVWLQNQHQKIEPELVFDSPVVLVGTQISASDFTLVPLNKLAGIVSYEGSALSHTAIMANALGVPAVLGTDVLRGIRQKDSIIVDGNSGQVILRPLDSVLNEYRHLMARAIDFGLKLEELSDLPSVTQDGTRIELMTNSGLQIDILPGLKKGAEGVGLYRTEIPFMVRQSFPTEDEQIEDYRKVLKAYTGKPVYMRTLDIGGDKQLPYFPITGEENPALGWRGIRFTLDNIQLMMTQVRAMMRSAEGTDQLHILLPMVSSSIELDRFITLLDDAYQQLQDEGFIISRPKVGVMVEVPAAISQLHLWKDKIDFISIGSNDLSQYLLALDRNNARVANRFSLVHPAVIHEISRIVRIAGKHQIPLSLCGEMAAHPVAVLLLIGMGMRRLSMSSAKLLRIKWLIRSVTVQQAEQFLQRTLTMQHADDIYDDGVTLLNELGLTDLLN